MKQVDIFKEVKLRFDQGDSPQKISKELKLSILETNKIIRAHLREREMTYKGGTWI